MSIILGCDIFFFFDLFIIHCYCFTSTSTSSSSSLCIGFFCSFHSQSSIFCSYWLEWQFNSQWWWYKNEQNENCKDNWHIQQQRKKNIRYLIWSLFLVARIENNRKCGKKQNKKNNWQWWWWWQILSNCRVMMMKNTIVKMCVCV